MHPTALRAPATSPVADRASRWPTTASRRSLRGVATAHRQGHAGYQPRRRAGSPQHAAAISSVRSDPRIDCAGANFSQFLARDRARRCRPLAPRLKGQSWKRLSHPTSERVPYLGESQRLSDQLPLRASALQSATQPSHQTSPRAGSWSVILYDNQTRSMLQTDQHLPRLGSQSGTVETNPDGSTNLYFGPTAPDGKTNNWLQTVPSKG
jgi:Protein of unknown function (DUF1214)